MEGDRLEFIPTTDNKGRNAGTHGLQIEAEYSILYGTNQRQGRNQVHRLTGGRDRYHDAFCNRVNKNTVVSYPPLNIEIHKDNCIFFLNFHTWI